MGKMFAPGFPPAPTESAETPCADSKRQQYQARGMGKGKGGSDSTLFLGSTVDEKTPPVRRQLTMGEEEFPDNQLGLYPESQAPPPDGSQDATPKISPMSKAAPASGAASLEGAAPPETEAIDKSPMESMNGNAGGGSDKSPMKSMNGNAGGGSSRKPAPAKLPARPSLSEPSGSGSSMYEDGTYWKQLDYSGLVGCCIIQSHQWHIIRCTSVEHVKNNFP